MSNEELGTKMKYPADRLDTAVAEFKTELVRLQGLLDAQTGKIREPKPYPIDKWTYHSHVHEAGSPEHSRWGNNEPQPSIALARAAEAYEESKLLVDENRVICAENKRIVDYLVDSIKNAGIPSRIEVIVSGPRAHRTKREFQDAPWMRLASMVKTRDTWEQSEQWYKDFLQRVKKWQDEITAKTEAEERVKAQDKARIEAESKRIALCLKYGFDPVKTPKGDLRDLLLGKNKYLRLAYYLELNRGDWSEGPDFAESGLNGFTIETPDDQLIEDDIQSHITNWDGDGRIFRDCTWNYGRIYAEFVPAELLADFQELKGEE
jgi:hypothetical protein